MKRNIIDILIKEQIAKGDAVKAKFNPDPVAVLPGKYIGRRGYEFAWNEVTKSYWMKPRKENAFEWRNMFYEPEYKSLSVKLRAAYDEYEKDLTDAIAKAQEKLNAKETSAEDKAQEKKKWKLFTRAKEKVNQSVSIIGSKISGSTIYKNDMYYFYKLENGVYSYQDASTKIDPNAWKVDAKVLTPEITSYIDTLPDRKETEMVTMYAGLNKIKDADGAEIKPLADPSDPNKKAGTNYIKLDGIYYSIPFTSKSGILKTTPLASIIYEPGKGLSTYKEKIAAIDNLTTGQYIYNKSTDTPSTSPGDDAVVNNKAVTVSKGEWDYKKEGGKYYLKSKSAKKWSDVDTLKKYNAKQKQTIKSNMDTIFANAKPEEKKDLVNAASNDLKTILTNINNTYLLGESFSANAIKLYNKCIAESKGKTEQELEIFYNECYNKLNDGFNDQYKPALTKAGNDVEALKTNANELTLQRIGYVLHNIDIIKKQKKGWINFYNMNPTPELNGKAEIYKIQDNTTDVIESVIYGANLQ